MEDLRNSLEQLAQQLEEKEHELALLKSEIEAIRIALEVEEDKSTELVEPPVQESPSQELSDDAPQEVSAPIMEEPTPALEPVEIPEPVEELSELEPTETVDQENITPPDENVIETMSRELDVRGIPVEERFEAKTSFGDKAELAKVVDLKKAIGLNERFLFANELFDGDLGAFSRAIEELNHIDNSSDADRMMNDDLAKKYQWDEQNETTEAFRTLVGRRFV